MGTHRGNMGGTYLGFMGIMEHNVSTTMKGLGLTEGWGAVKTVPLTGIYSRDYMRVYRYS